MKRSVSYYDFSYEALLVMRLRHSSEALKIEKVLVHDFWLRSMDDVPMIFPPVTSLLAHVQCWLSCSQKNLKYRDAFKLYDRLFRDKCLLTCAHRMRCDLALGLLSALPKHASTWCTSPRIRTIFKSSNQIFKQGSIICVKCRSLDGKACSENHQ